MKKAVTVQVNVRLPKGRVKTLRGDAIRFCKSVEGLIGMIVGDYTAKWVHRKFGLTVDIFTKESINQCLDFGRQRQFVAIQKNT